ncbi:activator-dependent family glycosyltransferase [Micromonospora ureilytica]|uniref:activator-dependent family glycosyltransferase n=1 Tax=Micromonospora ureilytica TaxID=709868 RepID=UPI00403935E3
MRVLFTSIEGNHFHQMVPLAWALRTAGHEVQAAGNLAMVDTITQTGLTAVPIDSPSLWEQLGPFHQEAIAWFNSVDTSAEQQAKATWTDLLAYESMVVPALLAPLNADAMLDQLVSYARAWRPDLVIWESFSLAGAIAAVATGAAHARLCSGPDLAMQVGTRRDFVRGTAEQPPERREDPTAEWLDWTLERLGAPAGFSEDMLTGQWVIDTRPPSAQRDTGLPTLSVRYVPYNGRCVVPDWVLRPAERPRVCLTLGTSITEAGSENFELAKTLSTILLALSELDVEIVAALDPAQHEHLPPMPENVRVTGFVPLNELLPLCSVVVHHGGYQTKSTADLHGIPQVMLVGYEWVSEGMGDEYAEQGTTLTIPVSELTAERLRDTVRQVLADSSFTAHAGRLRKEILTMPTPNQLVPQIERLVAGHRTGGRA